MELANREDAFLWKLLDGIIEGAELLTDLAHSPSEMEKFVPAFPKWLGNGHGFVQSIHVWREDSWKPLPMLWCLWQQ